MGQLIIINKSKIPNIWLKSYPLESKIEYSSRQQTKSGIYNV